MLIPVTPPIIPVLTCTDVTLCDKRYRGRDIRHAAMVQDYRSRSYAPEDLFRPHVRKQNDVANARAVREQHDQAIDADTFARGRRQAVFERANVIGIVV